MIFFEMMNNDFSNVMGVSLETQRDFVAPKLDETKRNANRLYQAAVAGLDEEVRAELGDDYLASDHAIQDKEGGNYLLGAEYADQLAGGDVWSAASGLIEGLPQEEREAALARLNACGTAEDGTRLLGELWRDQCRKAYREQEALENARYEALHGNVQEIVRSGNVKGDGEAWTKFFEDYGKGVWGSKEEAESMAVSIQRATEAFGTVQHGMLKEYTEMGSKVLTNASSAISALDALKGDAVAEGLFFQAVQDRVQDVQTDERERAFWEKLGRSFLSAGEQLAASAMGGHFRAFATDEQVEKFNAERGAMKERAKRAMGRGPSTADRTALSGFAPEDEYWEKIYNAAKDSGQLNADGTLRKMTEEERRGVEKLNRFRGQLFNAVQGGYDSANVFQKLGRMMPSSLAYLVPGGAAVSSGAMYTEGLANRLAEGEDFVTASQKSAVDATLGAMVEKMAFGTLKPTKWVPGLDWLMSRKAMAKALGGVYGTTAGRIGMGALVGTAEETVAEPLSQLLLSGVYNAVAADELRLDAPVGEFQKELDEMLKPEQLLVTAIYGLLLGGVNAGGHRAAARDYRKQVETLVELGVDEGRAAQVARIEDPKERREAVYELIDQRVKEDSKGVLAYLAELWPQFQNVSTMESYFEKRQLPRLIPAGEGMVKVQEKQEDGKVSEVVMAEDAAMLLVQARLEELSGKAHTEFVDMVLANAMAGSLANDSRWIVEGVDKRMDFEYFRNLTRAAGVRLKEGAKKSDVVPEVHETLPLGTLVKQGRDWEKRMKVARNKLEKKLGRKLSEEEWKKEEKKYYSRANRTFVRGKDRRLRTLLRVARDGYSALDVLEEVTEDNLLRDMQENKRELGFYVSNIKELERALGKEGVYLRELAEGEEYDLMDVVEGLGEIVQGKVLADTAKPGNGLSAALNAFLEMLRGWVLQAKALFEAGVALNKVLEDKEAAAKLEPEFREVVENLARQDVEWLKKLQMKEGLEAMARASRAAATGKASTPILDEAEAEYGEEVRAEMAAKEEQQRKVDVDVEAGEAALEGTTASVVNQDELDDIKARAVGDGTFMKAPNGEPTNLTEKQWLQVRTKTFKAWFGDWERAAELTIESGQMSYKDAEEKLAQEKELIRNDDTGIEVPINTAQRDKMTSPEARRKSISNGFTIPQHNAVVAKIRGVFKHAIKLGDYNDKNNDPNIESIKRFGSPVIIDGEKALAFLTVKCSFQRRKKRGEEATREVISRLYSVELDEIVKLDGQLKRLEHLQQNASASSSKEIIAKFNAKVKEYFENVSKIVDENGEPLVVYHGTPTGGFTIFRDESYFSPLMWYAEKYKNPSASSNRSSRDVGTPMLYEVFLNIRKPFDTRNAAERRIFNTDFFRKWGNGSPLSERGLPDWTDATDLLEFIEENELDYDGLILDEGGYPDGNGGVLLRGHSFVPVTPNQIKSATDNRGTFDGNEADMTMSVTAAQEQGLFTDGVLAAENAVVVEPGTSFSVTALHATPHRFRKFDTSKMGTGEGNQAFGWGLYFAESEDVNRDYHRKFSQQTSEFILDGKKVRELDLIEFLNDHVEIDVADYALMAAREDGDIGARIKKVQVEKKQYEEWLKNPLDSPYADWQLKRFISGNKAQLKALRFVKRHKIKRVGASNYRVELNVDDGSLLMWDTPVSDKLQREVENLQRQPDKVDLDAVFAEMKAMGIRSDGPKPENMRGYQVYNELARILGGNVQDLTSPRFGQGPKLASEWLLARGIKGIKYFDGFSRYGDKENRTYNYVIFSGDDVKITGVNETGDYNAEFEDYEDPTASFSVTSEMDERYMEAVKRGDMDAAQRMVNDVARMRGYMPDSDYQGSVCFNGAAPEANAYFDTDDERHEAWENGDFEGTISLADFVRRGMDPGNLEWWITSPGAYQRANEYQRESIEAIRKAKSSKRGKVTIYRAVPADIKEDSVRNGDWVTFSKKYAEFHISLQDWEKGRIIKQVVSIDDVWWDNNDVNEWGYDDGKEYAYRNTANNRKLLDAVTYDKNGDIVPLSKRFDYSSPDVSFSVVGENAANWDKIKHLAFRGRDDGKLRVEIDASQARLKWEDLRGRNVAAYRRIVEGWDKLPENDRKAVEDYAEQVYDWQDASKEMNNTPENEFLEQYNKVVKMRDAIKPKRSEIRSLLNKLFVEHGGSAAAVLNMKDGDVDELAMSLWGPYVESKVEDVLDLRPLWNGGMMLADVLDYPELYEAYPELSSVTVHYATMDNARGRALYGDGEHEILINRNLEGEWQSIHSILLHEIQHHIQNIEGFAKGGNPSYARRLVKHRAEMGDMEALALRELSDMGLYNRLAGEIEARNVQLRRDWTAAQRAARPFNETLEYPGEALVSYSIVRMDEERLVRDMVAAGGGFKANVEFTEKMVKEMRNTLARLRRLSGKTRTDREDAIAAMGSIVHMVKAVVQYLPKGYRFSVHPYLNKLEALAELAASGDIDLTSDIASKDILQLENAEGVDLKKPYDEMVKEFGNVKLTEALERIINRVNEQLRKHAKDRAVEKITELVERLAPKKDAKTGKLKGGKMSADSYRDLEDVAIAMGMNEEQLKAKLDGLNAQLAAPGLTEEQRGAIESQIAVYDQFGNLKAMTPEEALAAYESLRQRVWMHRFEWDNIMAEKRAARRAVINSVVDGVGAVSDNEYNAAKRVKKVGKRVKSVGNILSNMPQALHGLSGYLPLRKLARDMALRVNLAGEKLKAWEGERWEALEKLSRETLGKSWRLCMDDMHQVQGSGVTFRRPKYRTVSVKTEELRELLAMTPQERKAEMKQRREAGGLMAESALSEKDISALETAMLKLEEDGRELSTVETKYISDYRTEENLRLSKGEALYAVLMYEQPTYTERLQAQGYTDEVIAGLKEYIGEGMLQFGYGLRELFAIQGDRIAKIYEAAFGVPFPREENYFAARWVVNGMKENPAEQLLAGMMGTPGAGNGWQKQRVDHNLELDMTKDALQVFLQATKLTDTWMATQDIVADFKAWTRDAEFERALTVLLGKDNYDNLKDWIRILEMGGVQDCLNMGAAQDVINGLYGSGAVAILGFRLQTLVRQLPSVFNGLLGAHDISTGEWLATLAKMKHGEAPMTYKRMVESELMKSRQGSKEGAMAGQAARPGDMKSSVAEDILLKAMQPMEWVDARGTAISLVPVWNVYYARSVNAGASHEEAERAAWEQTALVANLASQPVGFLNKSKIAQMKNPLVKTFFYMLSENMAKVSMCQALWKGGNKKAALRGWFFYGAANAVISALLDYLQGDPEEFEKGKWWEYVLSAIYGPLASMPGIGEAVAALGTGLLKGVGYAFDIEELQKARTHAGAARAILDVEGAGRAVSKVWEYLTDDEEHGFAEYSRELSKFSRTIAIGTGWLGNAFGYWSTVAAVLMNPVDLAARMYRNFQHYYGEE